MISFATGSSTIPLEALGRRLALATAALLLLGALASPAAVLVDLTPTSKT